MNRTILKYIAIFAMILDHIALFFFSNILYLYIPFRIIGRIAFPLMCYFIVEGFKHTSNKRKYGLRLLTFAIISQIPWTLLNYNTLFTINFFINLNTIFTLFLGYLFLNLINCKKKNILLPLCICSTIILFAFCDYSFIGLLYISFFYFIKENTQLILLPSLYLIAILLHLVLSYKFNSITLITYIGLFLSIPMLHFYNHKPGKKTLFNKYFFYILYPLHLLIIYFFI